MPQIIDVGLGIADGLRPVTNASRLPGTNTGRGISGRAIPYGIEIVIQNRLGSTDSTFTNLRLHVVLVVLHETRGTQPQSIGSHVMPIRFAIAAGQNVVSTDVFTR